MKKNGRFTLYRIFVTLLAVGGFIASSNAVTGLYTPMPSFNQTNHVVSTSFFHWYTSSAGQLSGPWLPLEGRPAWTGESDWWKGQIKQTMMANIDILYVHLIPHMEQQRINLFTALNQLRDEGYDVPKIAPFLDPIITWDLLPDDNDMATVAGKDKFVDQYIRFFNQYYSVSQDAYADDYIAKFDGRVILDSWHPDVNMVNVPSLSRLDVMTRLQTEFGANSIFSNDIYMATTVTSGENYTFADEKFYQFETHSYYKTNTFNGIKTTQVKPGYWDQNVRSPGTLLPRDGGSHYTAAWNSVNNESALSRVYIESFNEYDEGSGIYAADTSTIFLTNGNINTDTWSSSNDPYEYLRTTAAGAAQFNDTPPHGAKILWHDIPASMAPGSTQLVNVVVRNTGDTSWTAAAEYKFGDTTDLATFGATRYFIDDNADEIPMYGGIFRGRAKTFQLTLIAPLALGDYETRWGMLQEGVEWFGEELVHTITVEDIPATVTISDLLQTWDGLAKNVSVTTVPAGLGVDLTYNGLTNSPIDPGSYTVIGIVNDSIYAGSGTNTLVIEMPAVYNAWRAEWFSAEQQTNEAVSGPGVYFDSDTFNNWDEYIAGTDPTDGQAFPALDMQPTAANGYILNWTSVSGRVYSIDWATDITLGFSPLQENLMWPQSSYTDQTHQVETKGFYLMNVSLPGTTTNATILAQGAAGVANDLFQGATVTASSTMHPAGFLAEDMFSRGTPIFQEDAIFADGTGTTLSFVEFNISSAVNMGTIVVGLINDHIAGDNNDNRALTNIKVYASNSPGTVLDNLVADVAVNPEYTTAYGGNQITVSIDLVAYDAQYFRLEFTEFNDSSAVRIMEVDGFAAE